MFKKTLSFLLLFLCISLFAQDNEIIKSKKAVVMVDNLFFRSAPTTKSKPYSKLNTGDIVKIISCANNKSQIDSMNDYWYKVEYNKKVGYLYGFFISEFNNNYIVYNDKIGKLIFLDKNYKIIKSINYDSYYIVSEKLKKENKTKESFQAKQIKIINDTFAVIELIGVFYIGSNYIIGSYEIYFQNGEKISSQNGIPFISISKEKEYIILNKAKVAGEYTVEFLNEIEIIDYKGKIIKKLNVKMDPSHGDEWKKNDFFVNEKLNKYVWINNSKIMVMNLNNLEVNYYDFEIINKYDPKNFFINLQDVIKQKLEIKIFLLPFEFKEGIDHKKISLIFDLKNNKFK